MGIGFAAKGKVFDGKQLAAGSQLNVYFQTNHTLVPGFVCHGLKIRQFVQLVYQVKYEIMGSELVPISATKPVCQTGKHP